MIAKLGVQLIRIETAIGKNVFGAFLERRIEILVGIQITPYESKIPVSCNFHSYFLIQLIISWCLTWCFRSRVLSLSRLLSSVLSQGRLYLWWDGWRCGQMVTLGHEPVLVSSVGHCVDHPVRPGVGVDPAHRLARTLRHFVLQHALLLRADTVGWLVASTTHEESWKIIAWGDQHFLIQRLLSVMAHAICWLQNEISFNVGIINAGRPILILIIFTWNCVCFCLNVKNHAGKFTILA